MFTQLPLYLNNFRKVPPQGKWVTLIKDLPVDWSSLPVKFNKLDIVYVYNEQIPRAVLERFDSRIRKLKTKPDEKREIQSAWECACADVCERTSNLHIFDIRHPGSQTLRAWDTELNLKPSMMDHKEDLAEAYDLIHFTAGNIETETPPILNDLLKDLLGALQIDGLSKHEAIEMIVTEGWLESPKDIDHLRNVHQSEVIRNLPSYYYKIKPEYASYFTR